MARPQRVSMCLWFDNKAEEAATFYTSLFPNSEITSVSRYGAGGSMPEGTAMMVAFTLDGVAFSALNGGPMFAPNEACSFVAGCDTQGEIDTLWDRLTADGGAPVQCGWLKDRFGFSWQIVPNVMPELMKGPHGGKVMAALMGMVKLDIAALEAAARG